MYLEHRQSTPLKTNQAQERNGRAQLHSAVPTSDTPGALGIESTRNRTSLFVQDTRRRPTRRPSFTKRIGCSRTGERPARTDRTVTRSTVDSDELETRTSLPRLPAPGGPQTAGRFQGATASGSRRKYHDPGWCWRKNSRRLPAPFSSPNKVVRHFGGASPSRGRRRSIARHRKSRSRTVLLRGTVKSRINCRRFPPFPSVRERTSACVCAPTAAGASTLRE